jgi:hypothetical protein
LASPVDVRDARHINCHGGSHSINIVSSRGFFQDKTWWLSGGCVTLTACEAAGLVFCVGFDL